METKHHPEDQPRSPYGPNNTVVFRKAIKCFLQSPTLARETYPDFTEAFDMAAGTDTINPFMSENGRPAEEQVIEFFLWEEVMNAKYIASLSPEEAAKVEALEEERKEALWIDMDNDVMQSFEEIIVNASIRPAGAVF